nr:MAG TPA_asm: hypothetical protein [Caudoviricetes sp.]
MTKKALYPRAFLLIYAVDGTIYAVSGTIYSVGDNLLCKRQSQN